MGKEGTFDVIVCGAGPAGCTTALFLARAGKKVLLLEKEAFPRDKVCADNKTWKCLDIVRELGLWREFEKLPKAEIRGVMVASPSGFELHTPLLEKDISEKGTWYNVRRELFDNMLADACRKSKNIVLREKCRVNGPIMKGGQVVGAGFRNEKGMEETAFAKVVVGADGSTSEIANSAGLSPQVKGRYALNARAYFKGVKGTRDRCELYYLKGICPGYFWIFPVDSGMCNVGIGMRIEDIGKMGCSLEERMRQAMGSKRFAARFSKAEQVTQVKQWGLSVLGSQRRCSGAGFVLAGDAGTFAMTFSGEGVGPSMRSGKIAAQAINEAFARDDFSAESMKRFDELMWKALEPEVSGFRWLEFLILHEWVFDFVAARAAKKPELIAISSRMQRDYTVAREMVSMKTLLKLLI